MYVTLHASCFKNPGFIVRSHSLIFNREARELRLRQIKLSHVFGQPQMGFQSSALDKLHNKSSDCGRKFSRTPIVFFEEFDAL